MKIYIYFSRLFSEVLTSYFFTVKELMPQPIRQSNPQNLEMTFSLRALNVHNASVNFCIDQINKHASYVHHMYLLYHIYGNKCFAMLHCTRLEREWNIFGKNPKFIHSIIWRSILTNYELWSTKFTFISDSQENIWALLKAQCLINRLLHFT